MESKNCLYCNINFNIIPSRKNTAKFCSQSCRGKYLWSIPSYRINQIEKSKGKHHSPETEIKKGQHLSVATEFKKGEHFSPKTEFKKGHIPTNPYTSEEMKLLWTNSNYKNYMIRKIMIGQQIKPNKPEKLLINLLYKNFKYVGDGEKIIGGLNPDFIDEKNKKIIELYGDYWHKLNNQTHADKRRIQTYKKYGYKTLIIWEHELKDINTLKYKIKEFIYDS